MCQVQCLIVCMNCSFYRVVVVYRCYIPYIYIYTLIAVSHVELEEQAMFIM